MRAGKAACELTIIGKHHANLDRGGGQRRQAISKLARCDASRSISSRQRTDNKALHIQQYICFYRVIHARLQARERQKGSKWQVINGSKAMLRLTAMCHTAKPKSTPRPHSP